VGAEIVVDGHVQGVGFRDFAQRCAERLGLVGYAMNLEDGRVRVVVEGARAPIEAFLVELERGPRLSRVRGTSVTWRAARGEFTGFGIRYFGHDA
jgi:acylphosphatase